jgi:nitrite reductase/ring-hydroxylating ferredoxin subunit
MALRLVNLHKQEEFTPASDPDKGTDDATVFYHRPLDAYEMAYLRDRLSTIEKMPEMKPGMSPEDMMAGMQTRTEVHKAAVDAVQIACTGFVNVFDLETGAPIEWESEAKNIAGRTRPVMKGDIVARIPVEVCMEFWNEIMSRNAVDPSAEKNSGKVSSPSNSSKSGTAGHAPKPKEGSGDTLVNQS